MSTFPTARPVSRSSRDHEPKIIEAALCLAGGIDRPEKYYNEQILDAADKLRPSVGLQQVLLAQAAANDYPVQPGQRIGQGNLRNVLRAAFAPIRAAGAFSTIDVSTIQPTSSCVRVGMRLTRRA